MLCYFYVLFSQFAYYSSPSMSREVSFLQKCRVARTGNLLKNLTGSLPLPCFLIVTRNLFCKEGVFLSFCSCLQPPPRQVDAEQKVDTTFKLWHFHSGSTRAELRLHLLWLLYQNWFSYEDSGGFGGDEELIWSKLNEETLTRLQTSIRWGINKNVGIWIFQNLQAWRIHNLIYTCRGGELSWKYSKFRDRNTFPSFAKFCQIQHRSLGHSFNSCCRDATSILIGEVRRKNGLIGSRWHLHRGFLHKCTFAHFSTLHLSPASHFSASIKIFWATEWQRCRWEFQYLSDNLSSAHISTISYQPTAKFRQDICQMFYTNTNKYENDCLCLWKLFTSAMGYVRREEDGAGLGWGQTRWRVGCLSCCCWKSIIE